MHKRLEGPYVGTNTVEQAFLGRAARRLRDRVEDLGNEEPLAHLRLDGTSREGLRFNDKGIIINGKD